MAGITYQYLHYLIGLRQLGYEPYYIEDSSRWVYDLKLNTLSPDASTNIAAAVPLLEQHGFADQWAFRGYYPEGDCYGMTEDQLLRLYQEADLFLNVTGAQEIREEHLVCPRRIYVESDPFAIQVLVAQGDKRKIAELKAHDTHFSFGENLGAADCTVPVEGFQWQPTRQPVVLDLWQNGEPNPASNDAYTTITTWKSQGKEIVYQDESYYWTKDREFVKFIELPKQCSVPIELAVKADDEVNQLLQENGWRQKSTVALSADITAYKNYIQQSRAEFTVARDQYVRPNTGWFSDRSACYLAAGRPVITQETGFSKFIPTGQGLFAFKTMDDILAAVDTIESDYAGNCAAAREIAAEYFAAEKVVGSLMKRAGL